MKKTITLKTLENYLNKMFKEQCKDRSKEWNKGYDSAMGDLQIQVDEWRKLK